MQTMMHLGIHILSRIIVVSSTTSRCPTYWWSKYPTNKLWLLHVLSWLDLNDIVEYEVQWIIDFILIVITRCGPKTLMHTVNTIFLSMRTHLYTRINPFRILLCILLNRSSIIIEGLRTHTWTLRPCFHLCLKIFSLNFGIFSAASCTNFRLKSWIVNNTCTGSTAHMNLVVKSTSKIINRAKIIDTVEIDLGTTKVKEITTNLLIGS